MCSPSKEEVNSPIILDEGDLAHIGAIAGNRS
jgi:hypothetical protein